MKNHVLELQKAVIDNDTQALNHIISSTPNKYYEHALFDINPQSISEIPSFYKYVTLMHLAAYYDSIECLEYIINKEILPIDCKSASDFHPLHFAILGKAKESVLELLMNGADPKYVPQNTNFSPLFLAAQTGSTLILEMLLDVIEKDSVEKVKVTIPAREALRCKHYDAFRILVERGTMDGGGRGFTPLMTAIANGLFDAVPILLQKGSDVNVVSENGNTALSLACKARNEELVRSLISERCINMSTIGAGGTSAIHWAASSCVPAIVEIIMDYGADPKALTSRGENALAFALKSRLRPKTDVMGRQKDVDDLLGTLSLLVEKGLRFDNKRKDGSNCLIEYLMDESKCETRVVEYIFKCGVDVNAQYGNSTLGERMTKFCAPSIKSLVSSFVESATKK